MMMIMMIMMTMMIMMRSLAEWPPIDLNSLKSQDGIQKKKTEQGIRDWSQQSGVNISVTLGRGIAKVPSDVTTPLDK